VVLGPDGFRQGGCRAQPTTTPATTELTTQTAAFLQSHAAAHDRAAALRVLDLTPPVIEKPNNRDYDQILTCLHALMKKHAALLREAAEWRRVGWRGRWCAARRACSTSRV
jgi:hypothetical protein